MSRRPLITPRALIFFGTRLILTAPLLPSVTAFLRRFFSSRLVSFSFTRDAQRGSCDIANAVFQVTMMPL